MRDTSQIITRFNVLFPQLCISNILCVMQGPPETMAGISLIKGSAINHSVSFLMPD